MTKKAISLLFILLCLTVIIASAHSEADMTMQGLVLWNKLGSQDEVENSAFGSGFTVTPTDVIYVDGYFGDAIATTGDNGYLAMSQDDFFGPDNTQGTVEVWVQKRIPEFIPFMTPLVGFFGATPYMGGNDSITAYWGDGYTGAKGLQFHINSSNFDHTTGDLGWDDVPMFEWVHVAFVWDLAGIDGSAEKMRIYRDGVVTGKNTDEILDVRPNASEIRVLGHHQYDRFGEPTLFMDNLIVWDYAKTDFSDRFTEEPGMLIPRPLLWNTLGSRDEVENSVIGADFDATLTGVTYVNSCFSGAIATLGNDGYLSMSQENFFGSDNTQGTVEVWVLKRIPEFIPFTTPLVGFFGATPYMGGNDSITAYWGDGYTGAKGLQFEVNSTDVGHSAHDLGWDDVPLYRWVHLAFVWDLDGIDGSADKIRIYRDGVVTGSNTDEILNVLPSANEVRVLQHHAYYRYGEPTLYMDNIIVWDIAKTDFSDRFMGEPGCVIFLPIFPG